MELENQSSSNHFRQVLPTEAKLIDEILAGKNTYLHSIQVFLKKTLINWNTSTVEKAGGATS